MKSSSCVGGGLVIVALGLLVVLIGCFAVPYELPKQKTDYLIIDNKVCSFLNLKLRVLDGNIVSFFRIVLSIKTGQATMTQRITTKW